MQETQEHRGREYLGRLLDVSFGLSQRGASDTEKRIDAPHVRAELVAAAHWIDTVLAGSEALSDELAAYRRALSELRASTEARLSDYASDPRSRTHLSQRLDVDIARARETLEAYDPAVKGR
jgi:ethanolamine ammonia-lyase small subunit